MGEKEGANDGQDLAQIAHGVVYVSEWKTATAAGNPKSCTTFKQTRPSMMYMTLYSFPHSHFILLL